MTTYRLTIEVDADSAGAAEQCFIDGVLDRLVSVEAVDRYAPACSVPVEEWEHAAIVENVRTWLDLGVKADTMDGQKHRERCRDAMGDVLRDVGEIVVMALAVHLDRTAPDILRGSAAPDILGPRSTPGIPAPDTGEASTDPTSAGPTLADMIRTHYAEKAERLTPEQRATLANAAKLIEAGDPTSAAPTMAELIRTHYSPEERAVLANAAKLVGSTGSTQGRLVEGCPHPVGRLVNPADPSAGARCDDCGEILPVRLLAGHGQVPQERTA